MRSQAVDQALDQRRAFTRACSGDSLLGDDVAGHRVATVEGHSREPIARGALRDVLDRVLLSKGRRDRETVVLANEDLRELVDGREVEGLVRVAFRARALAVAGHQDLVGAVHLQGVSHARASHQLCRHGRPARRDVEPRIREMTRCLLAAGCRVRRLREHREHEVEWCHSHAHAQDDIAVVRGRPVVLRL